MRRLFPNARKGKRNHKPHVVDKTSALTTRPWSKIGEVPSVHEVRLMLSVRKHQLQRLWHTGYQGWSPPELLPVTSGKVPEWDPLRSLKLSKIAALVIGWVTAQCNLVGRIGDRPRFPGVAGSNPTGGWHDENDDGRTWQSSVSQLHGHHCSSGKSLNWLGLKRKG